MKHSVLFATIALFALSSCKAINREQSYPKTAEAQRDERTGNLSGDGGLLTFGSKKAAGDDASGIQVNGYLWRAALEVTSFMPLISTDPFGGVIVTDWYSFDAAPHERFKLNAVISSRNLRSDAIRVTVFKQVRKQGQWVDMPADAAVARQLEDQILTEARKIRVSGKK
jgi:hypothetical protein